MALRYLIAFAAAWLVTATGYAQQSEAWQVSADSVFTMHVYRENYKVKVMLYFTNPKAIEYVGIERGDGLKNFFSQCKYIDFKVEDMRDTIIKTDNYPLPASIDVLYRLHIITRDGVSRKYPPVKLVAANDDKQLIKPTR